MLGPFDLRQRLPDPRTRGGRVAALIGGVNIASPIIGENVVFVPVLALGCYQAGELLYGPLAGLLAVLFVLGSPLLISTFHVFLLDAPLTAAVAIALWLVLASEDFSRPGISAAAGLAVGLGVNVQGGVRPVPRGTRARRSGARRLAQLARLCDLRIGSARRRVAVVHRALLRARGNARTCELRRRHASGQHPGEVLHHESALVLLERPELAVAPASVRAGGHRLLLDARLGRAQPARAVPLDWSSSRAALAHGS